MEEEAKKAEDAAKKRAEEEAKKVPIGTHAHLYPNTHTHIQHTHTRAHTHLPHLQTLKK